VNLLPSFADGESGKRSTSHVLRPTKGQMWHGYPLS
jgi:hypothetical protein